MENQLYPLVFNPLLQDRIWGGTKLKTFLGKQNLPTETTGESWELSAVEGNVSIVANGPYAGRPLTALLDKFPREILGDKIHEKFGRQFPLLFKFIDARKDLSIQVHPNDELANKRHNSFGKTEMWYVMHADEGARIIAGFKEKASPELYLEHLKNKNLVDILNQVNAKKGDVFFLETGTIHAIGGGIVISEIQQTSDITYRVYDWDRTDAQGKSRELHIEQALEAMNYNTTDAQKKYTKQQNKSNPVVDCPYFTTNYLPLSGNVEVHKNGSCFTVYICTEGEYSIELSDATYSFKMGDTVLMPAALESYQLKGEAVLLEVYIS